MLKRTALLTAQQQLGAKTYILKHNIGGRHAAHAHLAIGAGNGEARPVRRDDEGRNAGSALVSVRLRERYDEVGYRPPGDKHLLAVQDVVIAVLDRIALQRRSVRASVRLRQTVCRLSLSPRDLRQPGPFLVLSAADHDRLRRQRREQEYQPARAAVFGDLFDGQGQGKDPRSTAAILLRDCKAQQLYLAKRLKNVMRIFTSLIHLRGARRYPLFRDASGSLLNELLLLIEFKLHCYAPNTRLHTITTAYRTVNIPSHSLQFRRFTIYTNIRLTIPE